VADGKDLSSFRSKTVEPLAGDCGDFCGDRSLDRMIRRYIELKRSRSACRKALRISGIKATFRISVRADQVLRGDSIEMSIGLLDAVMSVSCASL
jgi:hypothetical protein